MKSIQMLGLAAAALLVPAISALSPVAGVDDVADEWANILNGEDGAPDPDLAVIFARGTFDSGNVGLWVGPYWRDALRAKFPNLAFQGVSTDDYPADMAGYIVEGGSESCAEGLANNVQQLVSARPDTKVVISGWSQGALCARKSLGHLSDDAASRVVALALFGDPSAVWSDTETFPSLPGSAKELAYCELGTPDALCTDPKELLTDDPFDLADRLKDSWDAFEDVRLDDAQRDSRDDIAAQLPGEVADHFSTLLDDARNGRLRRWMLLPQHFWYGIDGTVLQAAQDVYDAAS